MSDSPKPGEVWLDQNDRNVLITSIDVVEYVCSVTGGGIRSRYHVSELRRAVVLEAPPEAHRHVLVTDEMLAALLDDGHSDWWAVRYLDRFRELNPRPEPTITRGMWVRADGDEEVFLVTGAIDGAEFVSVSTVDATGVFSDSVRRSSLTPCDPPENAAEILAAFGIEEA